MKKGLKKSELFWEFRNALCHIEYVGIIVMLTEDEKRRLNEFIELVRELEKSPPFDKPKMTMKFLITTEDGIVANPSECTPTDTEILAFAPLFRQFYMNNSAANLYSIHGILWKGAVHCDDDVLKSALSDQRAKYGIALSQSCMEFHIDSKEYVPKELIEIYFYGHAFHRDKPDKRQLYKELFEESGTGQVARMVLYSAMHDILVVVTNYARIAECLLAHAKMQ